MEPRADVDRLYYPGQGFY